MTRQPTISAAASAPGTATAESRHSPRIGALRSIGFLSFFDRFATAPLIITIATAQGIGIAQATLLVTVYALCYALGQPVWGVLSDRFGRIGVLRVALIGTVLGSAATVISPDPQTLLASRAITGLFVGALFPTVLTMLGDRYQEPIRLRQIASLQTFTALGTTAATLAAAAIAVATDWRVVFALTAVGGSALAAGIFLPRHRPIADAGRSTLRSDRHAALRPWPLLLYLLGIVEGAVLLGMFTFIAPQLELIGTPGPVAGALAATYGVGIIGGSMMMRRAATRLSVTALIAVGGALLTVALLTAGIAAVVSSLPGITVAAILIGLSYSLLHGSLQAWATAAAPAARATTVSCFVAAVFLGSALATWIVGGSGGAAGFGPAFLISAGCAALLTAVAAALHRLWRTTQETR